MTLVAVSPAHVSTVLKLAGKIPTLKVIVAMGALPAESKQIFRAWGEQVAIKIMDLPECKQRVSRDKVLLTLRYSRGAWQGEPQETDLPQLRRSRVHLLYFCTSVLEARRHFPRLIVYVGNNGTPQRFRPPQ